MDIKSERGKVGKICSNEEKKEIRKEEEINKEKEVK